jgi:hypothetical protein
MMATYDPARSHFDFDVKRGTPGEQLMKSISDGVITCEVKTDYYFGAYKRDEPHSICWYVERQCLHSDGEWHPSGISISKDAYWVFKFGEHPGFLGVETEWLRRMVAAAELRPKTFMTCDYGANPTRGTLVFIRDLLLTRDRLLDTERVK